MGLLSGLLGNASAADTADVEEGLARILADGERIEQAFRLIRDLVVFTERRLILVDRQGLTGLKTEYHSIPYRAISHFSVESAGALDLEAELKVWISGTEQPIQKQFSRGRTIFDVQKALASHVGR
ncbi:MAG TPA: PH domain-containing protein [Vicinamibacterales bacterium]|nr:PH domain-containing protein [Vicinamibacterales bacterium]